MSPPSDSPPSTSPPSGSPPSGSPLADEQPTPRLARFWTRAAGRFVDLLLVNIAWIIGAALNTFWLVIASVGAVIWECAWLTIRGATPGKLLMDTRVVTPSGAPIGIGTALVRSLDLAVLAGISAVSLGASGYARLYYITSMLLLGVDSKHRRSLMDHIARTRVIRSTQPEG